MNEVLLFGAIGDDITAADVHSQLANADRNEMLTVRIHSEGGQAFEGFAIYDAFKAYDGPKRCVIESAAFSIASFVAMAFDDIEIAANGYLMMHNPYSQVSGDHESHTKAAEMLSKLRDTMVAAYSQRSGRSTKEIESMLTRETWLDANEALKAGFVSRVGSQQVRERVFAQSLKLPTEVAATLYGDSAEGTPPKEKDMSCTIAELREALPKASADFILQCVERKISTQAAMAEYVASQDKELEDLRREMRDNYTVAELDAEMDRQSHGIGHQPVARLRQNTFGMGTAQASWKRAVAAEKANGHSNEVAVTKANRKNPGLREAMLQEVNG